MPDYDFRTLSPVDFEHLVRDILNADLGLNLQSYSPGRDQGVDLRQVMANGTIIVGQCKHYLESAWPTFLRAVRKEAAKGRALQAARYLFVTSRRLTPGQQDKIVAELRHLSVAHDDVWGQEALNAALARCPTVERAHLKLWLSSTVMLDSLLNAGRWQRGYATLDEVRDQAKFWVHTPAYDQVQEVLEREGVCIVFGPPGAGKTFLAEMTLLSAVARDDWEVVHLSGDIEEAWKALKTDQTKQLFYFNDFLGETELHVASKNEPTNLARFMRRIRQLGKNKRFIMTTREQILGQAATSAYDPLRDLAAAAGQIGVRMGNYSARARAEILFNHLYFSNIPESDRVRLAVDNRIVSIVEHPSYNPRLIRLGIDQARQQTAEEMLDTIRRALDRPDEVWDTSFRNLPAMGRQILLSLATLPPRPWPLQTIRLLVGSTGSLEWKPTLRVLEPTWLRITGGPTEKYVLLANPSCRDYLLGLLDDAAVAEEQVDRIRLLDQVVALSRSAGLLAGASSPVQRSELAHTLRSKRSHLAVLIRGFVDADLASQNRPVRQRVKVLSDAAGLIAIYGSEGETDWLMDWIERLLATGGTGSAPADVFMLAQRLAALPASDQEKRESLTEQLVMTGISLTETTRDLYGYEDLPEDLRTVAAQAAAGQQADIAIAAELDYLMRAADEPEMIRAAAAELEHRASWYGLHADIGPLLDRAADLAAMEVERPSRSEPESYLPVAHDESDSISGLFSHLTE